MTKSIATPRTSCSLTMELYDKITSKYGKFGMSFQDVLEAMYNDLERS